MDLINVSFISLHLVYLSVAPSMHRRLFCLGLSDCT